MPKQKKRSVGPTRGKVTIRPQRLSDAKRYFEILVEGDFRYFPVNVKSLKEERAFLKKNALLRKQKRAFNFSILYDGYLVGAVGMHPEFVRTYCGEIGYFIDREYWGRGIVPAAVKLVEKLCFGKLKMRRLEILADVRNKASQRVAVKCGYRKEGVLKKKRLVRDVYRDAYMYAKFR